MKPKKLYQDWYKELQATQRNARKNPQHTYHYGTIFSSPSSTKKHKLIKKSKINKSKVNKFKYSKVAIKVLKSAGIKFQKNVSWNMHSNVSCNTTLKFCILSFELNNMWYTLITVGTQNIIVLGLEHFSPNTITNIRDLPQYRINSNTFFKTSTEINDELMYIDFTKLSLEQEFQLSTIICTEMYKTAQVLGKELYKKDITINSLIASINKIKNETN